MQRLRHDRSELITRTIQPILWLVVFGETFTRVASNALYPVDVMPTWLRVVSHGNPLTYEVAALRGLLIGQHTNLWLDFDVLAGAAIAGICAAAALLGRLAR